MLPRKQNDTLSKRICTLGLSGEGMVAFNVIYHCLEKSFGNNSTNSKLKSKHPLRNSLHLEHLGVTSQKLQKSPGAEGVLERSVIA